MINKGHIRFNLRTDQVDIKTGMVNIQLVYQIGDDRKRYSTGEKTFPANWDSGEHGPARVVYLNPKALNKKAAELEKEAAEKAKKPCKEFSVIPTSLIQKETELIAINGKMEALRAKIRKFEEDAEREGTAIDAEAVINHLAGSKVVVNGKATANKNAVTEMLQRYIDEHKSERAPGSLAVYHTLKQNLADFQDKGNKVTFETVGEYDFFTKFRDYLLKDVGLVNSTVGKRISSLRGILKYARTRHKVGGISDGFRDFKVKRGTGTIISLREEEFKKLLELDLSDNKTYANVRDAFIFSIATGYRRSDMNQLRRDHIKKDEIILTVTKTRQTLTVPLNKYSRAVLNRYKNDSDPLPLISDQKSNLYIKEICKKAGLDDPIEIVKWKGNQKIVEVKPKFEVITNHVARKTFATYSLEIGISIEVVMKIGGWKDYKSFQRYVDIASKREKSEMALWDKPKKQVKKKKVAA